MLLSCSSSACSSHAVVLALSQLERCSARSFTACSSSSGFGVLDTDLFVVDQDGLITEAAPSSAQDCQAPELMLIGQAVALEARVALVALALMFSSALWLCALALRRDPALWLCATSVPSPAQVREGAVPPSVAKLALRRTQSRGRNYFIRGFDERLQCCAGA